MQNNQVKFVLKNAINIALAQRLDEDEALDLLTNVVINLIESCDEQYTYLMRQDVVCLFESGKRFKLTLNKTIKTQIPLVPGMFYHGQEISGVSISTDNQPCCRIPPIKVYGKTEVDKVVQEQKKLGWIQPEKSNEKS